MDMEDVGFAPFFVLLNFPQSRRLTFSKAHQSLLFLKWLFRHKKSLGDIVRLVVGILIYCDGLIVIRLPYLASRKTNPPLFASVEAVSCCPQWA